MPDENREARAKIDQYVADLKSKVPAMEHGALESRLEELLNDSSADEDDVILTLGEEFDPHKKS
jgi:hypothetical protein